MRIVTKFINFQAERSVKRLSSGLIRGYQFSLRWLLASCSPSCDYERLQEVIAGHSPKETDNTAVVFASLNTHTFRHPAYFPIPPDVLNTAGVKVPFSTSHLQYSWEVPFLTFFLMTLVHLMNTYTLFPVVFGLGIYKNPGIMNFV